MPFPMTVSLNDLCAEVHSKDGPSLPLGKQLRWGEQPKILRPFHTLHSFDVIPRTFPGYQPLHNVHE